MLNILSYIGMNLQSEVCLWTLFGLLRTIFDATLFKVWQMKMPVELSLPVQRALRTTISGVMLVQCFTVYVYLASYIVLLYPVFLEDRPTLVLPWLLLAAIRNFLCELTSLALGLGTCVLLGPARPSCIRFVILKLASIMPAFYMWMLILGYYHNLKMASAFKTFPSVMPAKDLDYGVELAVRRRRTKSLQGEEQLRKKLIATLYGEQSLLPNNVQPPTLSTIDESNKESLMSSDEDIQALDTQRPLSVIPNRTVSDIGTYEDWFGSEVVLPRDTDRILEQFVLMLLRIGAFLQNKDTDRSRLLNSNSLMFLPQPNKIICPTIPTEETDTPPLVGSSKGKIPSYLRDYPQIFMKKPSEILGPINSPEKKIPVVQTSSSTQSTSAEGTDEVPLNKNSLILNNKLLNKRSSDTFIHSKENSNESGYFKNKRVENIDASAKNTSEQDPNKLKTYSTASMESVINRMKIRAACSQMSDDDNNVKPRTPSTLEISHRDTNKSLKNNRKKVAGSSKNAHKNFHLENTKNGEPKNGKNNHVNRKT